LSIAPSFGQSGKPKFVGIGNARIQLLQSEVDMHELIACHRGVSERVLRAPMNLSAFISEAHVHAQLLIKNQEMMFGIG